MNATDRAKAERLKAEIAGQQRVLDAIDRAIGQAYEARRLGVDRLQQLQGQLADIAAPHYAAVCAEAVAMAKDTAQGRAEDFRRGGDAA